MLYRLRFVRIMGQALAGPKIGLDGEFVTRFRVVPFVDTDVTRAFTHAYASMMALSRFHITFACELGKLAVKNRWIPFTAAETIVYRKPVGAFSLVELKTHLVCWDEKRFYLSHCFDVAGKMHALGYAQGLVRGPKGVLHPGEVFRAAGVERQSPPFPEAISSWSRSLLSVDAPSAERARATSN